MQEDKKKAGPYGLLIALKRRFFVNAGTVPLYANHHNTPQKKCPAQGHHASLYRH